jgi:hypothetical protein
MRILVVLLLACACSGGGGGGSSTPPPSSPVTTTLVSGTSPFSAACGGSGGNLYVNAEVEPHVAVDPRDSSHLVGVWQQDRWSSGSSRGNLSGVSFDAGATWTITQSAFSVCEGGEFLRATDPWVTIGPDGTVHQIAVASTGGVFGDGSSNAVLVARSTDGGRTWATPVALIRDGASAFNDKETITADPNDARFVYAVWDRIVPTGGGPATFARSINGGVSWEAARAIYDPGPTQQTIGNLIRVLPDGTVVNLYAHLFGNDENISSAFLEVIRSTDHGATWSAPIRVSNFFPHGAVDPATGQQIRDGAIVPQMAVAPNGALYVVWQDSRFSSGDHDGIALSRSTDGGLTWSAPVRVNSSAAVAAFTPQVHVRADGTIGVTFFDLRSNTNDVATLITDYWIARSTDGVTFTEARVADSFNINTAPVAEGGYFLGDYMGLVSSGTAFLAFYTRTTGSLTNRNDVFLTRIAAEGTALKSFAAPAMAAEAETSTIPPASAKRLAAALAARRAILP